MKQLHSSEISKAVAELCVKANRQLPSDLVACLSQAVEQEPFPPAKETLQRLEENLVCAKTLGVPICQDTGMAVVFVELGQEIHLTGDLLEDAVNAGVSAGYREGQLRCSIVGDPLERQNTNDNTPAILHLRIVQGDHCKITVAPKGFGSENMSAIKMMLPSATEDDIFTFLVEQVQQAGSNPCPPMVLGVGIGGNFEHCAYLAKKALCRSVSERNQNPRYARLEQRLLQEVNALGIGPQGFGGQTTALAVNIEVAPTHIAGLPVALNVGCHVTRHASMVLHPPHFFWGSAPDPASLSKKA